MKKCFVQDNDGHWYCIQINHKECFYFILDEAMRLENDLSDTTTDEEFERVSYYLDNNENLFLNLFDDCRLNMGVSNYSFENLEEI